MEYYLKKNHSPLITSMPPNSKAVVDIEDHKGLVYGHWVDFPDRSFVCINTEFKKIFSKAPNK